jgi:hypothetical protein
MANRRFFYISQVPELLVGSARLLCKPALFHSGTGDETKLRCDETIIRVGEEILKRALRTPLTNETTGHKGP